MPFKVIQSQGVFSLNSHPNIVLMAMVQKPYLDIQSLLEIIQNIIFEFLRQSMGLKIIAMRFSRMKFFPQHLPKFQKSQILFFPKLGSGSGSTLKG